MNFEEIRTICDRIYITVNSFKTLIDYTSYPTVTECILSKTNEVVDGLLFNITWNNDYNFLAYGDHLKGSFKIDKEELAERILEELE
jgi:hypothetical protein